MLLHRNFADLEKLFQSLKQNGLSGNHFTQNNELYPAVRDAFCYHLRAGCRVLVFGNQSSSKLKQAARGD